jgi:hypothetical protein
MLQLPLLDVKLRTRSNGSSIQAWDLVRGQWVLLTPEEHVRQLLLTYLIGKMNYPAPLMAIERGLIFGHATLRCDIVIYHRDTQLPWMLVECKSPDVPITEVALQQLLQYQSKLPRCSYWLLSNGHESYCADATNPQDIRWVDSLPAY